jgi:hypothetical protein
MKGTQASDVAVAVSAPPGGGCAAPATFYENRLAQDSRWALSEGSLFFEGKGAVQEALRRIATRLAELQIDYAVVGGMALFHHGVRRFTEDVDILVTRTDLKTIHERLEGLGYLPPFTGSKNLRDTTSGVKIEFIVTGDYPGDGKPKPVAFPDPKEVALQADNISYVNLVTFVELKIASGMTNPERIKDLADVQELIKALSLPVDFAEQLNPFVREHYHQLWTAARPARKRYVRIWRSEALRSKPRSLDELIAAMPDAAETLRAMLTDAVTLDPERSGSDKFYLTTTDPEVAKKYDMHDESEFLADDDGAS